MDPRCGNCTTDGKCTACKYDYDKLVDGKCVCGAIKDCLECSSSKVCDKVASTKIINTVTTPHTVVDTCPVGTHESLGKCYTGSNFV